MTTELLMTTGLAMTTIAYGNQSVPLHQRPHWRPVPHSRWRRLKGLTPTSRWFDLPPASANQWETHVAQGLGHEHGAVGSCTVDVIKAFYVLIFFA